jgi:carbon dioxide concentrating mechanism protein CcmN
MVHPTANVATGVMLHADDGSQLVIGAGACIGWGCVLHAHNGTLVIGTGVILGMGTLVIGNSQVGDYACIGPASSVINSSVAARAIVPPNSLINAGQKSPVVEEIKQVEPKPEPVVAPVDLPVAPTTPKATESLAVVSPLSTPVYGKKSLERLLATLRNEKPDLE